MTIIRLAPQMVAGRPTYTMMAPKRRVPRKSEKKSVSHTDNAVVDARSDIIKITLKSVTPVTSVRVVLNTITAVTSVVPAS